MSGLRIYTLYPGGRGGFTNKSVAYSGTDYKIVASSIKQAYYLAYNQVWISGFDSSGIISRYTRVDGYQLWDGCVGHEYRLGLGHSDGVRRINEAIAYHMNISHSKELGD